VQDRGVRPSDQLVGEVLQQRGPGGEVGVERVGGDAERGAEPADRQRLGPVPVQDSQCLTGGVVTGLVLGVVQALFSRRRLPLVGWTVATSVGVGIGIGIGIGLTVGSTAVGRGTGLGQLALQGR